MNNQGRLVERGGTFLYRELLTAGLSATVLSGMTTGYTQSRIAFLHLLAT